jgi:hypothetical protein
VDGWKSNRADTTTGSPRRTLEDRLLVDVLVRMAKVLVESERAERANTDDPDTTSVTAARRERLVDSMKTDNETPAE